MNKLLDDFEKIDTYEIMQRKDSAEITLKNLPLIKSETSFTWVPSKTEMKKVIDEMFQSFEKSIVSRRLSKK